LFYYDSLLFALKIDGLGPLRIEQVLVGADVKPSWPRRHSRVPMFNVNANVEIIGGTARFAYVKGSIWGRFIEQIFGVFFLFFFSLSSFFKKINLPTQPYRAALGAERRELPW
jgi:hypothetical protein